ncbi:hypothetical protein ACKFKG_09665 [Phormidesmis sp. 146-35]
MSERLDRLEAMMESQFALNAELRTAIEILNNTAQSQRQESAELRKTAEAFLQVVQRHQRDIELLTTDRQHRSDRHGA